MVPDGLTVSEIKVTKGVLTVSDYNTDDIVPANTGVMVSASSAGNKTIVLSDETGTSVLGANNMLRPSSAAMNDTGYEYFRLTMHNGTTIGFYYGAADGAAFTIGENKAYLAVPATEAGVKGFALFADEDETAIETIEGECENVAPAYNLMGQRVQRTAKGIVIMNGKKFINK